MRVTSGKFGPLGIVILLGFSAAACSSSSSTPTAPTTTGSAAAADGSTLKVSAPAGLTPASGTTLENRRPTLSWSSSSGTNVLANPTYDVQVMLNGAMVMEASVNGTVYDATTDLESDTTYTWRVRARQDTFAGPWSAVSAFTTAKINIPRSAFPLPFPPPASCEARPNQPSDRSQCGRDVAALSAEWASCRQGIHVACFRFNRQVAQALAAFDPRWGLISKNPGDTQCTMQTCGQLGGEGYGEDVVAYLPTHDDTNRWVGFDIISGTGGPTPGIQWVPIASIRAGNRWVPVPY